MVKGASGGVHAEASAAPYHFFAGFLTIALGLALALALPVVFAKRALNSALTLAFASSSLLANAPFVGRPHLTADCQGSCAFLR
eukprot:CAMPEP_0179131100 /NCGR_PEP_ID=MMETSP0796-20121207/62265_1 /TAXON_ID=73915 /ORGANISM="Pyrodinium bahamense, Strain pbaha01" /LENGTH=83 /DNA_ID=CAMNT_0020830019 /DNA_START=174 /DNA_END=426 /DNA_ORIENTATION=+